MRKRVETAAIVCCFGLIMCLCAGNADKTVMVQDVEINEIGVLTEETEQADSNAFVLASEAEEEESELSQAGCDEESEYANLAIANVTNYVNVRTEPNTDSEIVGKIYDGAVAQILAVAGEQKDWFQIVSGNVEGYIKAEFFLYGDAAAAVIDEYVTRYADVLADR